ncbi:hypothetical protein C900_03610 [Fulvivirga imtechensis AK7]|uniref:Outer membrane protein beta-barrel domain-containing protein n=1 Tax=Fulvivirga imtechensis AK7 TaxID=1237149 RepID=L8JT09_9BACT|nr:porin family protein [Fulvivirga imtechensis]ELR70629.1 hypothetical protein C900_03610 [Fulvivirga imtechensis AK7]
MINRILFVCTALLFLATVEVAGQKFSIGPLAGVHAYKVAFHHDEEQSLFDSTIKLGYRGGAYIEFPLENNFSWATEVSYARKGRKITYDAESITNDAAYNFFEISVLLRKKYDLTISKGVPGKFFFNVGPNINYWINGKGTLDAAVDLDYAVKFQESDGNIRVNAITDANRWLFGLEAGAGLETRVYDTQFFQFEFRFTYGQTYLGGRDSSEIPILAFQDSLRSNYRVISFIVRYGIDIDLRNAKKGKSTIKHN